MKPTLDEQISEHRKAIADLTKRAELCDTCNLHKSAAHWRAMIAASQAAIRACQRKAERDFVKAFTPNKYGEYA